MHVRSKRSLPSRDLRDAHADAHADLDAHGDSHQHVNAHVDANAWRERLLPVQPVFLWPGIRRRLSAGRAGVQCDVRWRDWAVHYVHTDANRHIDSDPDTLTHRHADANRHADVDPDIHAHAHAHEYTDANGDTHPDTHTDADANARGERLLSV